MELEALDQVLAARRSIRGFRPEPIERATLETLFATAQRAPSWCNTQPWRVVVTGPAKTAELSAAMIAAAKSGLPQPDVPFPPEYPEPYQTYRKTLGKNLYGAMGIARDDKPARYDAWLRNYEFFDAPHVAVISRDRRLGEYATLDVGVWLGMLFTAAKSMGIDTCAMASTAAYPACLRKELDIPEEQAILFGLALGYEDEEVPANACRTTREPASANVRFLGFS